MFHQLAEWKIMHLLLPISPPSVNAIPIRFFSTPRRSPPEGKHAPPGPKLSRRPYRPEAEPFARSLALGKAKALGIQLAPDEKFT